MIQLDENDGVWLDDKCDDLDSSETNSEQRQNTKKHKKNKRKLYKEIQ